MENPSISLTDLISDISSAMTQDCGQVISTSKLKDLLLAEAQAETVDLGDGSTASIEQMWLLFSGWKFRIGQAHGLLDSDPTQHDFWDLPLPQTKKVFSRLSRRVVHAISAFFRLYEQSTGVSTAEVFLASAESEEPLEQAYTRVAFKTQGLQVIRSHP